MQPSGIIRVPGANLVYQTEGSGETVVVLHGGPGIGYEYLRPELTRLLSDSVRLSFFDQRASGGSTGADDASRLNIHQFVSDLERVREALQQEQVVFLAHSFGGLLAMYYAIEYPDRVKALLLIEPDPASKVLWNRHEEVTQARQTTAERNELAAIRTIDGWRRLPELVAQYFQISLRPYFASAAMPPDFGRRFTLVIPENISMTSPAVRKSLGQWDLHPLLGRIVCPVLIVTGDASIFPLEAMEKLHSRIPNSSLVVAPTASHFPQIEAPEVFQSAVLTFLASKVFRHPG